MERHDPPASTSTGARPPTAPPSDPPAAPPSPTVDVDEGAPVRAEALINALRGVIDPELGLDIVELGMVRRVSVDSTGRVTAEIALTIAGCPLRTQIDTDTRAMLGAVPGVTSVDIAMGELDRDERAALMSRVRYRAREGAPSTEIPDTARVLAIASGKGGVGKSSVTVNLAVALASRGLTVGLLDADIWGFSVPRMLGVTGELRARDDRKIVPLTREFGLPTSRGTVKVVSMGFLADEEGAIMWRGLMLNKAVEQFLRDVAWGDLDYLLIDMPPGTGDVQMGLARLLPRTEMIIVTTPPLAAQKVAQRAADMARKGFLRVAGVIENMSAFTCSHGEEYPLFGEGGGKRLAEDIGVALIGSVPLDPAVAAGGDNGRPVAEIGAGDGDSALATAAIFDSIAEAIATRIAPVIEMSGCTARMLDSVEASLGTPVAVAGAPGKGTDP